MSRISARLTYLAILAAAGMMPAAAQEVEYRREIFGGMGGARTYDDEGFLGYGLHGLGGFRYRVHPRLAFEFEVDGFRHRRTFSPEHQFKGHGVLTTGGLQFYFSPQSKTQPYLAAGAGLLRYTRADLFDGVPRPSNSANSFAVQFGAGVRIQVTPRFWLSPDFRIQGSNPLNTGVLFPVFRFSLITAYGW
jgi:opacity protein-like surface antigen